MTLNEIHEKLENVQRKLTQNRFFYLEDEIKFNGELIIVVEELMLYKKALEIACEEFSNYGECLDFPMCTKCFYDPEKDGDCSEEFKNYFLNKAKEAAEDGKN